MTGDYSYSIWICPDQDSLSGYGPLISRASVWTDSLFLYNGKIRSYTYYSGVRADSLSNDVLTAGQWYNITAVHKNMITYLYIDGQEVSYYKQSTATGDRNDFSTYDIRVGAAYDSNREYYKGLMDNILIYDRALDESEIASLGSKVEYDLAGNLTRDHRGYSYQWDYENHLTKITKDNDTTTVAEYAYDAFGRRVRKIEYNSTGASLTFNLFYNGWQLLTEEISLGTVSSMRDFIYGNYLDETVFHHYRHNDGLLYYAHDHLYSPAALIAGYDNSSYWSEGEIFDRYEYDAYGKRTVYDADYVAKSSVGGYTNVGFTGQRLDVLDEGNLVMNYYKNRWYDTETGRFLSSDPLGYLADINMYQYVRSNSIVLTDSLGLWDERIHVGITGLVADLAGFGNCVDDVSGWANLPDEDWRSPIDAWNRYYSEWLKRLNPLSDFSEERLEEIRQQILEGARWHFPASGDGTVYPGSSDASEFMNQGIDKCDLQLFSEGIHTFQDSWSHQGRPVDGNIGMGHGRGVWNIFGIYIGIPSGFLTMISTSTDDPDLFGADVHDMADDLYKKFLEFAQNCPCACGGKPYNKPKKITDDLIPYDNRNVVDFDPVTNTYR